MTPEATSYFFHLHSHSKRWKHKGRLNHHQHVNTHLWAMPRAHPVTAMLSCLLSESCLACMHHHLELVPISLAHNLLPFLVNPSPLSGTHPFPLDSYSVTHFHFFWKYQSLVTCLASHFGDILRSFLESLPPVNSCHLDIREPLSDASGPKQLNSSNPPHILIGFPWLAFSTQIPSSQQQIQHPHFCLPLLMNFWLTTFFFRTNTSPACTVRKAHF